MQVSVSQEYPRVTAADTPSSYTHPGCIVQVSVSQEYPSITTADTPSSNTHPGCVMQVPVKESRISQYHNS